MEDDALVEIMAALRAKVESRDRRIQELEGQALEAEAECSELKEHLQKFDEECTELHQRVMTLGRTAGVKIDEMTKCLHDKNDSVTKLQERNKILRSVLDMKTACLKGVVTDLGTERTKYQEQIDMLVQDREAMQKASRRWHEKHKDAEEWCDYWKRGYFEVYAELGDQAKVLCKANEKLNRLAERPETYDCRSEYWEATRQLTAKQDECKDLEGQLSDMRKMVLAVQKDYQDLKAGAPTWRGRYWEIVGKLAARRDECKYLVKQNGGLKAKVKELEEGVVVAQGGFDNLVKSLRRRPLKKN